MLTEKLTKQVEVKIPFSNSELSNFLARIIEARDIMSGAKEELDAQKDAYKDLCEEQNEVIEKCLLHYKLGYSSKVLECNVAYDGNKAIFTDAETGEIVEGRLLESGEQLTMTGRVDAEKIIREASKNED